MNLALSGAGGFLGSRLAAHWRARGHEVRGLARGEPAGLGGVDVLAHLAHDLTPGAARRNLEGTQNLCLAAREAEVARQVYVSSYSARPNAFSEYARVKYELEQFFLARGHSIVRPGLVIGPGGLFWRNLRATLRLPVVPLVDGGKDLLPVIGLADFVDAMTVIVEDGRAGAFNLFQREQVSMAALLKTACRLAGRSPLFLGVPGNLAAWVLGALARTGIPIPVNLDNLRALKQNQEVIHSPDLLDFIPRESSLEELLRAAMAGGGGDS